MEVDALQKALSIAIFIASLHSSKRVHLIRFEVCGAMMPQLLITI
jgi:hypothetical protein